MKQLFKLMEQLHRSHLDIVQGEAWSYLVLRSVLILSEDPFSIWLVREQICRFDQLSIACLLCSHESQLWINCNYKFSKTSFNQRTVIKYLSAESRTSIHSDRTSYRSSISFHSLWCIRKHSIDIKCEMNSTSIVFFRLVIKTRTNVELKYKEKFKLQLNHLWIQGFYCVRLFVCVRIFNHK